MRTLGFMLVALVMIAPVVSDAAERPTDLEKATRVFVEGVSSVEAMKLLAKRCPQFTVTIADEKADYFLLVDRDPGKNSAYADNHVAVFDRQRDILFAGSTRKLANAIKDACEAMTKASP